MLFQLFAPLFVGASFFYITMLVGIFLTSTLAGMFSDWIDDDGRDGI